MRMETTSADLIEVGGCRTWCEPFAEAGRQALLTAGSAGPGFSLFGRNSCSGTIHAQCSWYRSPGDLQRSAESRRQRVLPDIRNTQISTIAGHRPHLLDFRMRAIRANFDASVSSRFDGTDIRLMTFRQAYDSRLGDRAALKRSTVRQTGCQPISVNRLSAISSITVCGLVGTLGYVRL